MGRKRKQHQKQEASLEGAQFVWSSATVFLVLKPYPCLIPVPQSEFFSWLFPTAYDSLRSAFFVPVLFGGGGGGGRRNGQCRGGIKSLPFMSLTHLGCMDSHVSSLPGSISRNQELCVVQTILKWPQLMCSACLIRLHPNSSKVELKLKWLPNENCSSCTMLPLALGF